MQKKRPRITKRKANFVRYLPKTALVGYGKTTKRRKSRRTRKRK